MKYLVLSTEQLPWYFRIVRKLSLYMEALTRGLSRSNMSFVAFVTGNTSFLRNDGFCSVF